VDGFPVLMGARMRPLTPRPTGGRAGAEEAQWGTLPTTYQPTNYCFP
jgi:hypothetical protein